MLFWVLAAAMTAVATLALLGPLMRARATVTAPASHDAEVYRDQLAEVERDLAAGTIEPSQADVARTEISRRLLAAARKAEAEEGAAPASRRGATRLAMAAVVILIPAIALSAYLRLGSPGNGGEPLAARMANPTASDDIGVLIAKAEQHLAENPDDGRGWDVLGPIYLRTGRLEDAAHAYRRAISLLGPTSDRQAGLGEALVSASDGVVTDEARLVFQSARELDPGDPRPSFYLAVAIAQEGRKAEAIAAFQALADRSPPDAPWLSAIERQIAAIGRPDAATGPQLALRGPSEADIAAAADMAPSDRLAMIRSMVTGLEARLKENPDDIEGWLRLIRSQQVLGDTSAAQAALARGFAAFPDDSEQKTSLSRLADELAPNANATLGGVMIPQAAQPAPDTAPAPFIVPDASALPSAQPPGNPSQADMAAAADMTPADRMEMVRSMVATLDARLTDNPDNIEGWLRLVRSYTVLGDPAAAKTALARARSAFADDAAKTAQLSDLAAELKLEQ
ncbi:cytochrome c-type biogenesis protein CcmH [Hoeflea marina]|uniref:Cytochrome c-type biogenesis protein CcmH n=1 Tax=Hoeflea marina TaxID=274592 RepID=A0A317PRN6_9HYPH|nr:c-type cytochrome biogenesis protein CcmI [Hoeflea marina]PWW02230.1 cytochrome c-type biogenesis protein CcmH [Hoeflea marina]